MSGDIGCSCILPPSKSLEWSTRSIVTVEDQDYFDELFEDPRFMERFYQSYG
ncbi:hypothetical protein Hanom_Chr03g00197571 [Helianthus anomalus]